MENNSLPIGEVVGQFFNNSISMHMCSFINQENADVFITCVKQFLIDESIIFIVEVTSTIKST